MLRPTLESIDWSLRPTVFCDSLSLLSQALEQGMPRDIQVKTFSPALAWSNAEVKITPVGSNFPAAKTRRLHMTTRDRSTEIFRLLNGWKSTAPYALALARHSVAFDRMVVRAGCVTEEDFRQPVVILAVAECEPHLNAPWSSFLRDHGNLTTLRLAEEKVGNETTVGNPAGLLDRVRIGGWEALVFRLASKLADRWPLRNRSEQVLVFRENELVLEGCADLAFRGVRIAPIEIRDREGPSSTDVLDPVREELADLLRSQFRPWMIPRVVDPCVDLFLTRAEQVIEEQWRAARGWREVLDRELGKAKSTVVVSNAPHSPSAIALSRECRSRGISFVGVQHGVSQEIVRDYGAFTAFYETNISDVFITFNEALGRIAAGNLTARGKSRAVGLPRRHLRAGKAAKSYSPAPVTYISTNIYSGNLGTAGTYRSDVEKAELELEDLRHLNHLPHQVFYKPYPVATSRYPDPDPVIERAEALENLTVYQDKVDLRYMLGTFRVIVMGHATSTFSWALLSGSVVVFLNDPLHGSVKDDLVPLFRDAVFYFDRGDPDMWNQVTELLSQDLSEIERHYHTPKKTKARRKLIEERFGRTDGKAGRRFARLVFELFEDSAGVPKPIPNEVCEPARRESNQTVVQRTHTA